MPDRYGLRLVVAIVLVGTSASSASGQELVSNAGPDQHTCAPLFDHRIADDGNCGTSVCGSMAPVATRFSSESDWCQRARLTGNWGGYRDELQSEGIAFRGTVTQFAFGVSGGINAPVIPDKLGQGDTFEYTGRGEYDMLLDLDKLGGLPSGKLVAGLQHWWGRYGNISLNSGTFAPPVFPAALPVAPNDPGNLYLTDFLLTQPLTENLILAVGKKNVIGAADQDVFAGGDGTDQFMNQALIANPAFLLALPYSSFTVALAAPQEWGVISGFVMDPQDRTTRGFDLDGLFEDGVIVGGEVKLKTRFFDRPGEHHVGGIWKHIDLFDLSFGPPALPEYPYPPVPVGVPTKSDSFTLYYGFDQYFQVFPGMRKSIAPRKPPRGWGMFARASISDGNPTPYRYFFSAGIGGDSRFGNDRGDTFGIGWFYNGVSDEFGPVINSVLGPRDGTGVELYYSYQLTPWMAVTPDLQFIRPGNAKLTSGDDAIVYGVRVNMLL